MATFATEPIFLTGFQTSTIDADSALRSISIDPVQGTTLYDALVLSSNSLASEDYLGRVIIIVTDGNETRSEATIDEAIAAAQDAGVSVYVVGIESKPVQPRPAPAARRGDRRQVLRRRRPTALAEVYSSIAEELSRTWRLEYVTSALPSEKVALKAKSAASRPPLQLVAPGDAVATRKPADRGPAAGAVLRDVLGPGLLRRACVGAHHPPRRRVRLRLAARARG